MPIWFLYAFVGIALVALAWRVMLGHAVVRGRSATPAEVLLVLLGALGLAYHCGSMFFASEFAGPLGLGGYAHTVAELGAGSMLAFAVPCVVLLAGIVRPTPPWYVVLVAAALVAVGVTIYDGGSLDAHLAAIMAAAVVIIGGILLLGAVPRRRGRTDTPSGGSRPATT